MTPDELKSLISISGTDLAKLVIPKPFDPINSVISGDFIKQIQAFAKLPSNTIKTHKALLTGLQSNLTEIAKVYDLQYKPQITAYQSIAQSLQSLIWKQTKFESQISNFTAILNPSLEAIKTISSYNAFKLYRETYNDFGGSLNPDNITDQDIQQTVKDNRELIEEINKVVIEAEEKEISPGDTPALIFEFLNKKIPRLSKKTFTVIILIGSLAIITYELYSHCSTHQTLDNKIVPKIEEHSGKLDKLTQDHIVLQEAINKANNIADETNASVDNLQNEKQNFEEKTQSRLDSIIVEMKKFKDK